MKKLIAALLLGVVTFSCISAFAEDNSDLTTVSQAQGSYSCTWWPFC